VEGPAIGISMDSEGVGGCPGEGSPAGARERIR